MVFASVAVEAAVLESRSTTDLRHWCLAAFLTWGVAVVGLTELLSAFGQLRPGWLIAGWALVALGSVAFVLYRRGGRPLSAARRLRPGLAPLSLAPSPGGKALSARGATANGLLEVAALAVV